MNYPRIGVYLVLLITLFFSSGCVTHIKTDITQNPPPTEKFSAFNHVEIEPLQLAETYAGRPSYERPAAKIQENIAVNAAPLLAKWNTPGTPASPGRTLHIKPVVTEFKFVKGGRRFLTGPFSGSSAVILRATITEKETGKVIAEPIFYARAAAMSGGFTFGAMDNVMLIRIAGRFTQYLAENYPAAVGGPTGARQ